MSDIVAFLLPPAIALAGDRCNRLLMGTSFAAKFGWGARFGLGLALGMLLFTQVLFLVVLAGVNVTRYLAWAGLLWGAVEAVIEISRQARIRRDWKLPRGWLWWLVLVPVLYSWWVFSRLSVLEGTLEFDGTAFWVFKAKMLYLVQGRELLTWFQRPELTYAHWDYPMLVPALYTLGYGAGGAVNEFINKVWPFWMIVALSLSVLSFGNFARRPGPLPVAVVTVLCFLPATMQFIRLEGATVPMVFYVGMASLLLGRVFAGETTAATALMLVLAGCASTKFEGMIFTALAGTVLLAVCWRRGLVKVVFFGKTARFAVLCLAPYLLFRLTTMALHPESNWWHTAAATPNGVWQHFPQVLFLNIADRFFNTEFFHWTVAKGGGLAWIGQPLAVNSLTNQELATLPWLVLMLVILGLWRKETRWFTGVFSGLIIGELTLLAFVISSLPRMQGDRLLDLIDFSARHVGRYYYPFFAAWFLGLAASWFK